VQKNDLDYSQGVARAVKHFWRVRAEQARKQNERGRKDQGARSAVTGGAQMSGFIALIKSILLAAGLKEKHIFTDTVELPGYFRATKEWDILAIQNGRLLAAIEAKSQVGSFGNNFNNRTEEALGSALDLWTAHREMAYSPASRPWLGYLFHLEDCPKSRSAVACREPHYPVFSEFRDASYAERYIHFCRRIVLERHYNSAALILSSQTDGRRGTYNEPAPDLTFRQFAQALRIHVMSQLQDHC
jgi:hypothetical protein